MHAIRRGHAYQMCKKVFRWFMGRDREDIPPGIQQSTTMAGGLWKEGVAPFGKRDQLGMDVGGREGTLSLPTRVRSPSF